MPITNLSRQTVLAERIVVADTFLSRMVGLLTRTSLKEGEALVITRCNSIHMFFMRFPIDAIFIDKDDVIVGLVPELKPFRLSPIFLTACACLELPAGTIARTNSSVGDHLKLDI